MKKFRIMKRLSIYFFNGLLVILPIAGTLYLLNYFYKLINGWGNFWLTKLSVEWKFPGIGLITVLLLVLLIGFGARLWITKKLLETLEAVIERIPLIKGVYGTLKDTLQSFIGEKKSFDTVVFVTVADSKRIGFLTVKEPVFKTRDGKEYVGVYFPQSMQFAGDLHWFERERVEKLDLPVDEALQLVLSAGVAVKRKSHPPVADGTVRSDT
ncbi:DUF502 domain-containing protein [Lihuaxuella thermophila]|uniref:Uncharacterized membrane protein n=1 Tax=Lihuaxuella thermophila TaxID=1173111 RepID=A0A1H8ANP3_9BACL|nr:DUF502 domain-containing protein [Lihuaxuella thermophila]SEM72301.1 Uncharacterized membrane protein [Lihuaxuella thermophila]